jgi:cation diffusion facilitator CzcD-associated flavoprotein CzcO
MTREADIDVAIVGAGISGISMAAHLRTMCPGTRFALFERRLGVGGTWDLFRYPGVRWSMVTCAALSAIAGTMVTAVAPEPITTTRLPA